MNNMKTKKKKRQQKISPASLRSPPHVVGVFASVGSTMQAEPTGSFRAASSLQCEVEGGLAERVAINDDELARQEGQIVQKGGGEGRGRSSQSWHGKEGQQQMTKGKKMTTKMTKKMRKGEEGVPVAHGIGSLAVVTGWLAEAGGAISATFSSSHQNLPSVSKALRGQARNIFKQLSLLERAGIGAIAGGLAGGFTNATLHPIDTVKTKLQTKGSSALYSGSLDVIRKVSASQGLSGFYRGLPAAIVGSVASSSIYFGTYEISKELLSREIEIDPFAWIRADRRSSSSSSGDSSSSTTSSSSGDILLGRSGFVLRCPTALVPPVAAALGNISSSAILIPKEVVKQRLQAGAAGSAVDVIRQTLQSEGVGGLYRGYSAALLRNLPTNMLNFSIFEYLKAAIIRSKQERAARHQTQNPRQQKQQPQEQQQPSQSSSISAPSALALAQLQPLESLTAGAIAGATSAALTTPLDVVKTRMMTQARIAVAAQGTSGAKAEAVARARALAAYTYTGIASTLAKVLEEEGAKGLIRGMAPRVLYAACFSAIGFLSFETARAFLIQVHLENKMGGKVEEKL